MSTKKERIEAAFMLASYLETIGFNNRIWEFNYGITVNNINTVYKVQTDIMNDFLSLGGPTHINIMNWKASDDTIAMIATAKGILNNYKEEYIKVLPLLKQDIRASGLTLLSSIEKLKRNQTIEESTNMGGNGCAMRTMPIGIAFDNEKDIIMNALESSKLTHNYYIGYLGGVVSALFSHYAFKGIEPTKWVDKLLSLADNNIIQKYVEPEHVDDYMKYWRRYKEIKHQHKKPSLEFLMSFNPSKNIQEYVSKNESLDNKTDIKWNQLGITGIDSIVVAYDCLMSSKINGNYSWSSFLMLVSLHIGDSDTTACIGGFWYGALLGYNGFDPKKMKQLEFHKALKSISRKFIEQF
jgi:ADP-ribosylglycohydrolase